MADATHETDAVVAVRWVMDPAEWGRANLAALGADPRWRWIRRAAWTLPLIVPLPFIAALAFRGAALAVVLNTAVPWEITSLVPVFALEFWSRMHPRITLRQFRGRDEERVVSAAGLDVAGSWDATYVPWSEIRWVTESAEFLFFRSSRETYFIPKRLLGEEGLKRAVGLAHAHYRGPIRLLRAAGRAT